MECVFQGFHTRSWRNPDLISRKFGRAAITRYLGDFQAYPPQPTTSHTGNPLEVYRHWYKILGTFRNIVCGLLVGLSNLLQPLRNSEASNLSKSLGTLENQLGAILEVPQMATREAMTHLLDIL